MTSDEQLKVITEGRIWQTVQAILGGDWERRNELFTISQAVFDAWADSTELPFGRVHAEPQTWDEIYVENECGFWRVYEQERGRRVYDGGEFADYTLAKRHALAIKYLFGITLAGR